MQNFAFIFKIIFILLIIKEIRESKSLTQDEMVAKTGIPKRSYVDYENGKADIKLVNLRKIASVLNVSISELIGETKNKEKVIKINDNLNDNQYDNKRNVQERLSSNVYIEEPKLEYNSSKIKKIPFFDCVSINGLRSVADLTPLTEPSDYIDPGDLFRDADAAMRTYEDSMLEYPSGCAIFLKEVLNRELIVYGNDYVIETDEYRVTKKLQQSEKVGYWILASTNLEVWESGPLKNRLIHEPFDVKIDHVRRIYKVLGVTSRTGSSKILMNNRLRNS